MRIEGGLGSAKVMHRRLRPRENAFVYPAFYVALPLDRIDRAGNALFGVDRLRPLALLTRDHGPRDGSPWRPWLQDILDRFGLGDLGTGNVLLMTHPRVFGHVFNPVSFWFVRDDDGRLRAVLAEVNNTFGDRHNYLVAHDDGRPIQAHDRIQARKVFHVSPFCAVDGHYLFRFRVEDGVISAATDYHDAAGPLLLTAVTLTRRPLDLANAARLLASMPVMTLQVVARIHWQALRLWLRGTRFHRRPAPPMEETTR